jgi:hypothetical protein
MTITYCFNQITLTPFVVCETLTFSPPSGFDVLVRRHGLDGRILLSLMSDIVCHGTEYSPGEKLGLTRLSTHFADIGYRFHSQTSLALKF